MAAIAETFPSGGASPPLDVFMPIAPGEAPAVLVLYGSFGTLPEYSADIVSCAKKPMESCASEAIPHGRDAAGGDPPLPQSHDRTTALFDAILQGP